MTKVTNIALALSFTIALASITATSVHANNLRRLTGYGRTTEAKIHIRMVDRNGKLAGNTQAIALDPQSAIKSISLNTTNVTLGIDAGILQGNGKVRFQDGHKETKYIWAMAGDLDKAPHNLTDVYTIQICDGPKINCNTVWNAFEIINGNFNYSEK